MNWSEVKQWISVCSGLQMDALHVHGSIFGLLTAAFLLRRPLTNPLPWLAVLLATAANEWFDLTYDIWSTRHEQYLESVKDVWNTMLAPTVLLLVARYFPRLFNRPGPRIDPDCRDFIDSNVSANRH